MQAFLSSLLSGAANIFGGVWGYLGTAAIGAAGAAYLTHAVMVGQIDSLKLANASATTAAVRSAAAQQHQIDGIALVDAVAEAQAQNHIVTQTQVVTKEIPVHVPTTVACVPLGLIRVLNDAALGRDPSVATDAPGQPDDACASVSWRSIAADLTDDYFAGNANAEQLNALESSVRALHDAAK